MLHNWAKENWLRLALLIWLQCTLITPTSVSAQTDTLVHDTVHSAALEKNLLGDSPKRSVYVYLPPSYKKTVASRYPTIYLLHGFKTSNKQWRADGDVNIRKIMDDLIATGKIGEMILVMPDSSNKYGGSVYTNSVTTGNWEDFLTQDLIHYIDTKYRTKSQAASRGIAGHSMGGYGAIKLGMKYPDIYGAVYALSACCLGWGTDFSPKNAAWDATLAFNTMKDLRTARFYPLVFMALSAAWSPNPDHPPFFVDFLVNKRDGTRQPVADVQAKWSTNMPLEMVERYKSNLGQLRGIAFDVGTQDASPHIPAGARAFSRSLRRNGIQHVYEEYEGDHSNRIGKRIQTNLVPFFSRVLEFKTQAPLPPPR